MTQKASELGHSKLGNHFYKELTSQDPCIWMDSVLSKKISSFLPLLTPYEHAPSLQEITDIWWKEHSSPPSHMWLRPSGQITGTTQDWTHTARLISSLKNN